MSDPWFGTRSGLKDNNEDPAKHEPTKRANENAEAFTVVVSQQESRAEIG